MLSMSFVFQAEDGIRYLVRSRGLGDVYKRQTFDICCNGKLSFKGSNNACCGTAPYNTTFDICCSCLLYTSDAADERSSVDLGGRRIIKKKKSRRMRDVEVTNEKTMRERK